jgi:hypothetical protein
MWEPEENTSRGTHDTTWDTHYAGCYVWPPAAGRRMLLAGPWLSSQPAPTHPRIPQPAGAAPWAPSGCTALWHHAIAQHRRLGCGVAAIRPRPLPSTRCTRKRWQTKPSVNVTIRRNLAANSAILANTNAHGLVFTTPMPHLKHS